jgi:hypothetical protein
MIKKIMYSILMFALPAIHLFAQKGEKIIGVFKTAKDFSEENLSFFIDCGSKESRISLNDFLNKDYLSVKEGSSVHKLFKDSVYGYKTCNGKEYLFFGSNELLLINPGERILIYKEHLPKPLTGGKTNVTNYYFSVGKDKGVQKLTINNLKMVFRGSSEFRALIDKNFRYNSDLVEFDKSYKMYKINLILRQSGVSMAGNNTFYH